MQTVQLLTAFFFLNLMAIFDYKTLQGLVLEGRFIGGFFALQIWGAYTCIWRGVYMEGLIFGILRQLWKDFKQSKYNGSQCEKSGKIYEINLVLTEIWEKESNRIAKLFMEGNE